MVLIYFSIMNSIILAGRFLLKLQGLVFLSEVLERIQNRLLWYSAWFELCSMNSSTS